MQATKQLNESTQRPLELQSQGLMYNVARTGSNLENFMAPKALNSPASHTSNTASP